MAFQPGEFFVDFAEYLRTQRADVLVSAAVMAANKQWLTIEAAAFLDRYRDRYGLDGSVDDHPKWWISCEHEDADIWLVDTTGGDSSVVVLELTTIRNDRSIRDRIYKLRRSLSPKAKDTSFNERSVDRFGICLTTYARTLGIPAANDQLIDETTGAPMSAEAFKESVEKGLTSDDSWYEGTNRCLIECWEDVAELDESPYIDPGKGSKVSIVLAVPVITWKKS